MNDSLSTERKRKPSFVVLGLLVLAAATFFGHSILWSHMKQSKAARTYEPVDATVLSSRLQTITSGSGSTRGTSYHLDIEYRYEVGGREYRSNNYSFMGIGYSDYYEAKKAIDRYPADRRFEAYFDPDDPADSVIYRTPPPMNIAIMASPFILFGVIGLLLVLHGFLGTRKPTSD